MNIIINNPKHPYFLVWGKIINNKNEIYKVLIKDYSENKTMEDFFSQKFKEIEIELKKEDFIIVNEVKGKIPKGSYCYFGSRNPADKNYKPCPFWGFDKNKPEQESGFCKLLNCNDWEHDTLLWDQCKSCGINDDLD